LHFIFSNTPWLWGLIIVILSLWPTQGSEIDWSLLSIPADKIIHFFLYGIWSVLLMIKCLSTNRRKKSIFNIACLTFAITFFTSLFLELIQMTNFVNRTGDVFDIIANITGTFAGILLLVLYRLILQKK